MDDLRPYFQTLDDVGSTIDWREFFGNDNPVELDVGSGRGLFLVNAGLQHPETNFVGIEIEYREGRRAARRLKKRQMSNVRVLGGDVDIALTQLIPAHSLAAVHVYFPDPWWKRKHRRRRVFTDVFVDRVATVLQTGGLLHAWTDVEEYFRVIAALVDHHDAFEPMPPPSEHQPEHDMDYQTSYERKRRQAGEVIHRGRWRRKPRGDT